jgi:hypothetical protein
MKELLKLPVLFAIATSAFWVSCDKVDDPYEGIAQGGEKVVGDSIWSDTTHSYRMMYIEELHAIRALTALEKRKN